MKKKLSVMKFGGGAFGLHGGNLEVALQRITETRSNEKIGPVVVVSAPKTQYDGAEISITDAALDIGSKYAGGQRASTKPLFEPYAVMSKKYLKDPFAKNFFVELSEATRKVELALGQSLENRRFVDVNRARVLAYSGEILMGSLVSYVLQSRGFPAFHPSPKDWPIISDDNFESATPLFEESKSRVEIMADKIETDMLLVVGGYVAFTRDGLETTFERGGSDRTAADLAILLSDYYRVSLDLEKEEIVKSADPAIIQKELDEIVSLSYNEAYLAGLFGMKIIDPVAITDIMNHGIEIPIRVTCMPSPDRITRIERESQDGQNPIKIICGKRNCAILELEKSNRQALEDYLRKVRRFQGFLELRPYSKGRKERARFLILEGDYAKRYESELKSFDEETNVSYGLAALTLVGDRMGSQPGIAAKAFNAVFQGGINIEDGDIQQPTSSILIIVKNEGLRDAIRALHAARKEDGLM